MSRIPKMKADERRQHILDAALKVFSAKGYHLTTTKELALVAGVSEPLIYKYFQGKKDLYLSLLAELRKALISGWEDAEKEFERPEDVLRAFGMGFYWVVMDSPEIAKVVFQTLTEVGMEEVLNYSRSLQLELHEKARAVIEAGIKNGTFKKEVDADLSAWRFLSIGFTISMMSILGFHDRLGREKILEWGDIFSESLKSR